jgi:DNA polymerase-4
MERRILCFHIPSFEIALARLEDRSLTGQPIALGPLNNYRGLLWEVSAEARQEGIYAGMSVSQARRLCPKLRILTADAQRLSLGRTSLVKTIGSFTPIVETAKRGEFYLDLTGCARLFGQAADIAARIKKEIATSFGIYGVMGVANNKLVSGVAANLFEDFFIYDVRPGEERSFLAPLSVVSLPDLDQLFAPKTNEMMNRLDELRLKFLGQIAGLETAQLGLIVGAQARLLKQWALGIDPSPVWSECDQPSLEVSHAFERDEIDDDLLLGLLYRLLERLCKKLRNVNRFVSGLRLTLQYSDGREVIKRQQYAHATFFEGEMYPNLEEVFLAVQRRIRIRKMALSAEVVNPIEQLTLFHEEKIDRLRNLTAAVDSIRERYGERLVWNGMARALH